MDTLIIFAVWAFILFRFRVPVIGLIRLFIRLAQHTSVQTHEQKNKQPLEELNHIIETVKEKAHVHSNADYNKKNYIKKKTQPIKVTGEPTVKRRLLDQRDSEQTVVRKSYD